MPGRFSSTLSRRILYDLLCLPTAPFAEHAVIDHILRYCARRKSLALTRDAAGNVLVRLRRGRRRIRRPVCLTAHLDHPGFVAQRMTGRRRLRAKWFGGVPKAYFVGGTVRFHVNGRWTRGRVRSVTTVVRDEQERVDTALIDVDGSIPAGAVGMWDFPDPRVRGTRIYARGCDDLAGAAAMLAAIDELVRSRESCDACFLFTRAEEVGFAGALAAVRLKTIPRTCYVVAVETSAERPDARMGDGPILRVGDRASTFTTEVTAYCHRIARDLAAADRTFHYQRKLMDGGTCEASAYCTLGYEATGLCLALGNYHNVNLKRSALAPEYIDLNDYDNAVKWFTELARSPRPYLSRDEPLYARLRDLDRTYAPLLRTSRTRAC